MNKDDQNNKPQNDDDAELHQKLMALDWDMEPENDLWAGISNRLDALPKLKKGGYLMQHWVPYAIAASFLLAVVSLLVPYINFDQTREIDAVQAAYAMHQQSQVDLIVQQHQMVRAQFVRLIKRKRDQMDPGFILELESALSAIDRAADELKMAIEAQPLNPNYPTMLVNAYQQEIKLLNKIKFNEKLSI